MKKNIIITGANGNLGKAVSNCFLENNYKVWAAVHKAGNTEEPGKYHETAVELSDENRAAAFVQEVIDQDGFIHCAVLTAGGFAAGDIMHTDNKSLQSQFDLNFITAYNMAKPVFSQMQKQKNGRIFLIGSKPGFDVGQGKNAIAYALSKSLIFRLAEILNALAGHDNIVTSVIVPGTIDTPANREAMPGANVDEWVSPKSISETILFYASEAAAAIRKPVIHIYNRS